MFSLTSYENDPDLFMFDYRDDLETRAKERERVFTLNKFVEADEIEDQKTLMSFENKKRANKLLKEMDDISDAEMGDTIKNSTMRSGVSGDKDDGEDSEESVEKKPERTQYPEVGVAKKFGGF